MLSSADYRPQLLKNLVGVGANINHGEAFKRSVQEEFVRAKKRIYKWSFEYYITDMATYENKYELN